MLFLCGLTISCQRVFVCRFLFVCFPYVPDIPLQLALWLLSQHINNKMLVLLLLFYHLHTRYLQLAIPVRWETLI